MRTAIAALLLLSIALPARADTPPSDRVRIIDYGIYSATEIGKRPEHQTAMGHINILTNIKRVTRTDEICARLGSSFGIEFVLEKAGGIGIVELEWVTRFPPPGVVNRRGKRFQESVIKRPTIAGVQTYRSYKFEEPWEMVPGVWTFEFRHQGRKLGEKSFNVETSCPIS